MSHDLDVTVIAPTHAEAMQLIATRARKYFGSDDFAITGTEAEAHVENLTGNVSSWRVEATVVLHADAGDIDAWLDKQMGS